MKTLEKTGEKKKHEDSPLHVPFPPQQDETMHTTRSQCLHVRTRGRLCVLQCLLTPQACWHGANNAGPRALSADVEAEPFRKLILPVSIEPFFDIRHTPAHDAASMRYTTHTINFTLEFTWDSGLHTDKKQRRVCFTTHIRCCQEGQSFLLT